MSADLSTPPMTCRASRVLIVDDHPFFSEGLAMALRQSGCAEDIHTATSVHEAHHYLTQHENTELILLDLGLPDAAGLTLIRGLTDAGLPIPVVVVSSREDEGTIRATRAAGAQGFMPKSAGTRELKRMVSAILKGDHWFPTVERQRLDPLVSLTPRQQEVLDLLAAGLPNKRICQELQLTSHTVKTHLKAIFATLQVHNRTECVLLARELGLVD